MNLVILISSYREGTLITQAVRSALDASPEAVIVWEGPAGPDKLDGAPVTTIGFEAQPDDPDRFYWAKGEWATDAHKRNEMLKWTKNMWQAPLWGLWLDADEVLGNPWALRDVVQGVQWADDHREASIVKPDNPPTGGIPIRRVEPDGSVDVLNGNLVRLDLIREYHVSLLVATMINGAEYRLGNQPQSTEAWGRPRLEFFQSQGIDKLFHWPPLPGEPHIIHRSNLRHPLRRGSRLHEQELEELKRLGLPVPETDETGRVLRPA